MKSLLVGLVLTAIRHRANHHLAGTRHSPTELNASRLCTRHAHRRRPGILGRERQHLRRPRREKGQEAGCGSASLLGGRTANADAGLGAAVNTMKTGPDASRAREAAGTSLRYPVGWHRPVSVTVRRFQSFCNGHTMKQDEEESAPVGER